MIRLLLLALLCCQCTKSTPAKPIARSPNQSLASISLVDRNGFSEIITAKERLSAFSKTDFSSSQPYQKVTRTFTKDNTGTVHSLITTYHANGQLHQYLEAVNARARGTYAAWHPNGRQKLLCQVIEGVGDLDDQAQLSWSFHSTARAWDEDGHLLTEIHYLQGELHGISHYYYPDGQLSKEAPYLKGLLDGVVREFSPIGMLKGSATYSQGQLHGESVTYWHSEQIASREQYDHDLLMEASYYAQDGTLLSSIHEGNGLRIIPGERQTYAKGLQEGEVTTYDARNAITSRYTLQNGLKHGEELFYYSNGKPKLSVAWHGGKIHGLATSWYDNGVQESQREMANNKKHGLLTAWYRDGALMLIEEYDRNRLVKGSYLRPDDSLPVSEVIQGTGTATLFNGDGTILHTISYVNGNPADDTT